MESGKQIWNFSAGPCCLPKNVLEEAQKELLNWQNSGISVMEMSHRGKEFVSIAKQANKDFRDLMSVPESHKIFFFQGGATMQFSAVPLNLLGSSQSANYITTGTWSAGALKEAKKYCKPVEVWPESGGKYNTIGSPSTWNFDKNAAYFHYCDNETIGGVEFNDFPYEMLSGQNLVSDMSSNFVTRPIDWDKYACVYAGAQKNVGPAGVCITVIRDDLFDSKAVDQPCPTLLDWKAFRDAPDTFLNTPCCWSIYVCGLSLAYMKQKSLKTIEEEANTKSKTLYDFIDGSDGYYSNPVDVKYRSRTNIPFRIKCNDELEAKFLKQATGEGFMDLKGHRSVGGCRASVYNGMPQKGVDALVNFMKKFRDENH